MSSVSRSDSCDPDVADFQFVVHRDVDAVTGLEPVGFSLQADTFEDGGERLQVRKIHRGGLVDRHNEWLCSLDGFGADVLRSRTLRPDDFILVVNGRRSFADMKEELRTALSLHLAVRRPRCDHRASTGAPAAAASRLAEDGRPCDADLVDSLPDAVVPRGRPKDPPVPVWPLRVSSPVAALREELRAGGHFEVRRAYDGVEFVDGLQQLGYLAVSSGEFVSVQANTFDAGAVGNQDSFYVFGWLDDSSRAGWLPVWCFQRR